MEHQVLFGKNFKKSQLHINTHTEARDGTERKDSKRKTSKTEDPILIYGDRVNRVIVADWVGRKKKKETEWCETNVGCCQSNHQMLVLNINCTKAHMQIYPTCILKIHILKVICQLSYGKKIRLRLAPSSGCFGCDPVFLSYKTLVNTRIISGLPLVMC